jgi:CrcB protein
VTLLAVFAGGAIGALARVGLVEAAAPPAGSWPWVTFVVNVAGAAILGWVVASGASLRSRRLIGTGFCGALTTFSTLQLELFDLLDAGHVWLALSYAAASLAAGLAVVALAFATAGTRPS